MSRLEQSPRDSNEQLMLEYLEATISPGGISSLDRVRLKQSGWHVWALGREYRNAPPEKTTENEKIDHVARQFHIPNIDAEAGIDFYKRHQALFDARIQSFSECQEIDVDELISNQRTINNAQGRIDPLFPPASIVKL